jgi:hypothetical protein
MLYSDTRFLQCHRRALAFDFVSGFATRDSTPRALVARELTLETRQSAGRCHVAVLKLTTVEG